MTPSLKVDLKDRSYPIYIGHGVIKNAGSLLSGIIGHSSSFIVTDENVAPLYLSELQNSLKESGIQSVSAILPAGEKTKSFEQLTNLTEQMLASGVNRHSTIIALGGGVIGDITGFASAVTMRGINFVQVPTTLLAQVDSAVGGKTGINTTSGKNLVGSFHQPKAVISDTSALNTLPKREVLAGYAEICKYGLINAPSFWEWLENNGTTVIAGGSKHVINAVKTSCESKAHIVAKDELEKGVRGLLNLGHTFGHAFEAEFQYSNELLHGEAVSIGITLAFEISEELGLCPTEDKDRVLKHFRSVGLPTTLPKSTRVIKCSDIISHMQKDKKAYKNKITFVLTRGIGKSFLTQDVPLEALEKTLNKFLQPQL
jgi:3-dehydroquinate synthase